MTQRKMKILCCWHFADGFHAYFLPGNPQEHWTLAPGQIVGLININLYQFDRFRSKKLKITYARWQKMISRPTTRRAAS